MGNPFPFANGPREPAQIQRRRKQSIFGRKSSLFVQSRFSLMELFCFLNEGEQAFDADAQVYSTVRFHRALELVDALLEVGNLLARMRHGLLQHLEIQEALHSLDG